MSDATLEFSTLSGDTKRLTDTEFQVFRASFRGAIVQPADPSYINFMTEDEGVDRTRNAYGKDTLARLATLKHKYDPDALFRHTKRVAI